MNQAATNAAGKTIEEPVPADALQRLTQRALSSRLLPLLVLAICLAIGALLYSSAAGNEATRRAAEVNQQAETLRSEIINRLQAYLDTLPGLRALCLLQDSPDDRQFERYIDAISLQHRFPGQALTFIAQYVKPEQLERFERSVASDRSKYPEGHVGFHVKPPGKRAEYMVIRHVFPFTTPSFGYDLYDPAANYRSAAEAAVLSDRPVATAPLLLAHERDEGRSPARTAVVVRLPVYVRGSAPLNEAERKSAAWGLVGVSFRTLDLVSSVLPPELTRNAHVRIVDIESARTGGEALIFDSSWLGTRSSASPVGKGNPLLINIGTRQWSLEVIDQKPAFANWTRPIPLLVLIASLAISLLFAALTYSLIGSNRRAEAQVAEATRRLLQNQRNLEEAQRITRVGFFELNIETRRYTASAVIYEILGLDPAMGEVSIPQYQAMIHPDDLDRVNQNRRLAIAGADPVRIEYRIIRPDGEIRTLDGHGFVTFDEHGKPLRYSGALQDITERKQAEEALRETATQLRIAGRVARLGAWSVELPPGRVFLSDEVCAIHEMPPGFAPTMAEAESFYAAEYRSIVIAAFEECVQHGRPFDLEVQFITAKGRRLWVRSIGEAVRNAAGEPIRIQGAFQDISERKAIEVRLADANRSLQMLTRCNEALVRAQDERSLLEEICRVAVDIGGYRLSWVGYAQHDAERNITPQAFAGAEDGYLGIIRLDWKETNEGPASQAIRTGKPAVVPDFSTSTRKGLWTQAAKDRNLPGVICLPLSDKGQSFGMIALYPPEIREVPDNELRLLQELADNVAFGIIAQRTRDALREREERFKNLARATSDGIWDCNLVTDSIWRNAGWANMLGFTPDEVQFTHAVWAQQIHPDDRECVVKSAHDAINGDGEFWSQEYRMLRKDGSIIYVSDRAYISRDEHGKAVRLVGGMTDLTGRVESEKRIREQAELLDRARDAIFVCDLDQTIRFWNKGAERLYGWTAKEVVGRRARQFNDHDAERYDAGMKLLVEQGEWVGEFIEAHKDGSPLLVEARWTLVRDAAGKAVSVLAIHSDITDRRQAEALRTAKEAAEMASAAKSEFLARMSHELRTPLNSILGFAQLLQYAPAVKADESVARQVGHIFDSGQHLVAMVDDILDLSRIESGGLSLSPEDIDVARLVGECVEQGAPHAARAGVEIRVKTEFADSWVRADRTRLRQILLNLLSNAIKYNRRGGSVDILLGGDRKQVRVAISDTGVGLDKKQQASLFQPFNRLGAESSGVEGTGIGLVIVKQLLQAMQGSMEVDSQAGVGSTFTLVFPRTRPGIEAGRPAAAPARPDTGEPGKAQFTVLYVEDNPANVILVQEALKLVPGVQLEIAVDGPSGLAAAKKLLPDLVLLDINLPGMDGFAVFDALRADPASANIPCIALSANAMSSEIKRARDAGFADYITKPLDVNALLARLHLILREPG